MFLVSDKVVVTESSVSLMAGNLKRALSEARNKIRISLIRHTRAVVSRELGERRQGKIRQDKTM